MSKKYGFFLSLILLSSVVFSQSIPFQILSPDSKMAVNISLDTAKGLTYQLSYLNQPVVLSSKFGINVNGENWEQNLVVKNIEIISVDTVWKPIYGERSIVKDQYNEAVIDVNKAENKNKQLKIIVRVYNQGLAFRFLIPELENGGPLIKITGESTEYRFPDSTKAWYTSFAQQEYQLMDLSKMTAESERPLTLELNNGLFACVGEAAMVNYSRTKFKAVNGKSNTIKGVLYDNVEEIAPFASPWRWVMVAETAGALLENNDLIENLNPPNQIANSNWIKPGKVFREVTLSTIGAKKAIEFASKHQLQYILFDAGWYGYEYHDSSDARRVSVDPKRNPVNALNLQEVIAYGKSKGIGVILYVNQRALAKQLDSILPIYHAWGVAGVKFGFVHVGSFKWTTWMHEAVRKCAQYQLMVDIHDEYRPTGFSRTYPNLMTQEGILGNEGFPTATHNTILPFTRFIAGAADYTFCYYRQDFKQAGAIENGVPRNKFIKTTAAHQLALAAIFYSPLQHMYWYDKPSDSQDEPELAFWDHIPTVWDQSKVLVGSIGKYIAMARRKGTHWFIGAITNNDARDLDLPLDFLQVGQVYEATIYKDDTTASIRTHVAIQKMKVDSNTILHVSLPASGGQAIDLIPVLKK
jgi:alpha-glucosidase